MRYATYSAHYNGDGGGEESNSPNTSSETEESSPFWKGFSLNAGDGCDPLAPTEAEAVDELPGLSSAAETESKPDDLAMTVSLKRRKARMLRFLDRWLAQL